MSASWLPELVTCESRVSNWTAYEETIYGHYDKDFLRTPLPKLFGRDVRAKAGTVDNRNAGFWHLISESSGIDSERVPDFKRCERIRWPRAMIEAVSDSSRVRWWENDRRVGGKNVPRLVVSLPDFTYVVILATHERYFVLWSAYTVEHRHRREKHQKECDAYWKAKKS